jgi:hypothetical protein
MAENPLRQIGQFGQSIWLDYIRRHMITSGELQRLHLGDDLAQGLAAFQAVMAKALAKN